jgi:hypothetical protein
MKIKIFASVFVVVLSSIIIFRYMNQDTPKNRTAYALRDAIERGVKNFKNNTEITNKIINNNVETKEAVPFTSKMEAQVVALESQKLCNGSKENLLGTTESIGSTVYVMSQKNIETEKRLINKIVEQYINDCLKQ